MNERRKQIMQSSFPAKGGQQGAVLITALLLLLVLTILGTSSIQNTVLQERMAGNMHQRNLAFQAAEAALREGEDWLTDLHFFPTAKSSGLSTDDVWALDQPGGDIDDDYHFWWTFTDDDWWFEDSNTREAPNFEGQVAEDPRYVIEYRFFRPDSLVEGFGKKDGKDYHRITARGVGQSATARSTLQSQFVRRYEYR